MVSPDRLRRLALYRRGSTPAAKMAMREALKHSPSHAAATTNLAAFMRITGEAEAAEAMLRESLAQQPDALGAWLNLAAALLHAGLAPTCWRC
jgi:Tfp pilus assembly protein PilF